MAKRTPRERRTQKPKTMDDEKYSFHASAKDVAILAEKIFAQSNRWPRLHYLAEDVARQAGYEIPGPRGNLYANPIRDAAIAYVESLADPCDINSEGFHLAYVEAGNDSPMLREVIPARFRVYPWQEAEGDLNEIRRDLDVIATSLGPSPDATMTRIARLALSGVCARIASLASKNDLDRRGG